MEDPHPVLSRELAEKSHASEEANIERRCMLTAYGQAVGYGQLTPDHLSYLLQYYLVSGESQPNPGSKCRSLLCETKQPRTTLEHVNSRVVFIRVPYIIT